MFKSTRLKLTIGYIVITMLFTLVFSYGIYFVFGGMVAQSLQEKHFTTPEVSMALAQLRNILLVVNFFVFCAAGIAGYFLSGKTLKPVEKNMEEQKRFVSDASHEFRTPLTALKTSIEVNKGDKEFQTPAVQDLLQRNLYQIDKLQDLTDSLLLLAQYQKRSKLELDRVSLEHVLESVVGKLKSLADAKKIKITVKAARIEIRGEQNRLSELFTILLENAIKYSPHNTTITVTSFADSRNASVSIQDNGVGITKKDLPHIFDRFYRAESSRTKEGYGLGLSIAKNIVEMHKGTISVESEENKGTRFIVRLPLRK